MVTARMYNDDDTGGKLTKYRGSAEPCATVMLLRNERSVADCLRNREACVHESPDARDAVRLQAEVPVEVGGEVLEQPGQTGKEPAPSTGWKGGGEGGEEGERKRGKLTWRMKENDGRIARRLQL